MYSNRLKSGSIQLIASFLLVANGLIALEGWTGNGWAQTPPDAIYNYNAGIQLYNQGKSGEAIQKFQQATAMDPQYAAAYYNMGSIYYQMAQYDNATNMFKKAVSLSPQDHQARYNLALCYEKQKSYSEALNALSLIPSSDSLSAKVRQKASEIQRQKDAATATKTIKPAEVATKTTKITQPAKTATSVTTNATSSASSSSAAGGKSHTITRIIFSRGYDGPTGIAIGPGGFMYVANYLENAIYRVGANGDKTLFVKESQGIKGPIGMAYNPKANELYVANYLNGNVVKISSDAKASVLMYGLTQPYNLFFDDVNNTLYVSEQKSNIISKITLP
jgi:tetratricopeptide (TPR) repeat protein